MESPVKKVGTEDLVKKVEQVFDQYFMEEHGNRLSQFSFSSFKNIVLTMIGSHKLEGNKKEIKK